MVEIALKSDIELETVINVNHEAVAWHDLSDMVMNLCMCITHEIDNDGAFVLFSFRYPNLRHMRSNLP